VNRAQNFYCPAARVVQDNPLVQRRSCRCHGTRSRGKRLPMAVTSTESKLAFSVRRAYVSKGMIEAVKTYRSFISHIDLQSALDCVKEILRRYGLTFGERP
jgi:hypothetical protein